MTGREDSRLKEFTAGILSAFVTISFTYPVTKLMYRQILENAPVGQSLTQIKGEGIYYLYRGMLPPLLQRGAELSMMFGVYKSATMELSKLNMNQYLEKLSGSFFSGTAESIFSPFERVQILLVESKYHHRFKNMKGCVELIFKEYSLKEFYRGFHLIVWRNIIFNSSFFILKDELLCRWKKPDNVYMEQFRHFAIGGVLGGVIGATFYPIKVVKTNIHRELGGEFITIRKAFADTYRRDNGGFRNFYRGVVIATVRSLFTWGVTNVAYEIIRDLL